MKVKVEMPSGLFQMVEVQADLRIDDIILGLGEEPAAQRILLEGRQLDNDKTVGHYDIEEDSVLYLVDEREMQQVEAVSPDEVVVSESAPGAPAARPPVATQESALRVAPLVAEARVEGSMPGVAGGMSLVPRTTGIERELTELGLWELCQLALGKHPREKVNECGSKAELRMLLAPPAEDAPTSPASASPESARPPFGSVAALLVTVFVDYLGVFLSLPILPFLVLDLGGNVSDVGYIMAAFSAAQLLSMIWMPLLSDKIGRKPVVIMSNLGSAVGYIAVGLSGKIWMLYAFRTVGGLFAGTMGVVQAQLSDIVPAPLLPTYQGYLTGSLFIGLAFGPTIAGSVSTFGNDVPFHVAGAMAGLSTINTLLFLKGKKKEEPPAPAPAVTQGAGGTAATGAAASEGTAPAAVTQEGAGGAAPQATEDPPIPGAIYVGSLIRFLCMTTVRAQGAVIAVHMQKVRGWAALEVSFLYMGLAVLQILFQAVLYKPIYEKLSLGGVSMLGCIVGAIFSLLVEPTSRVSGPWGTVLFIAVYELFMVGGVAALLPLGAITGTLAPKAKRGKAASIDMAAGALGQVVGSLVAPRLWETTNFGLFAMCSGLQVVALFCSVYLKSIPLAAKLGKKQEVTDERVKQYESAEKVEYDKEEERRFLEELRDYIQVQFRRKNLLPAGTTDLKRREAIQAAIKLLISDALPPLHAWGTEEREADLEALRRRRPHVTRAMRKIIEGDDPAAVLQAYT